MIRQCNTKVRIKGYGFGTIVGRTFQQAPRYDIKLDRYDGLMLREVTEDQFLPINMQESLQHAIIPELVTR